MIIDTFTNAFNQRIEALIETGKVAENNAAVRIIQNALPRTPVETGELRKSAYVAEDGNSVEFGYSSPYALFVHEIVWKRYRVGEAKFLRNAISWWTGSPKGVMKDELRQALTKGRVASKLSSGSVGGGS